MSVYCYLAVGLARKHGYDVPNNFIDNATSFLGKVVDKYSKEAPKVIFSGYPPLYFYSHLIKGEKEEGKEKKDNISQRTLRWLRRAQSVSSTSAVCDYF